jgi:hypothetical protein
VNELTSKLQLKDFNFFQEQSAHKSYERVSAELLQFQSTLTVNADSNSNRELLKSSNEALKVLSYKEREIEDHANFSSEIDEDSVYKVYTKAHTLNLQARTSNVDELVAKGNESSRLICEFNNYVSKNYINLL